MGIGAKKRLQQQRIQLAETAFDLSEIQIELEVKKAWSEAFQAKKKFVLYRERYDFIDHVLNDLISVEMILFRPVE